MPLIRLLRAAFRVPGMHIAVAPPQGRRFAFALIAVGLGLLTIAVVSGPILLGAQAQAAATAAHDPGLRTGPAAAGGFIAGLTDSEKSFFNAGLQAFNEVDSVSGSLNGEEGKGLGPRFNLNSCAGCHAQPAIGGSSPAINPQVKVATLDGATNRVPFFVTSNGPVREARFIKNPDGTPDGGVHDIFTIAGRTDAPGCNASVIQQPNFAAQAATGNLVFRTPTPVYGAGLIASIPDYAIVQNMNAQFDAKARMGIMGQTNREGNAGTISRYGWKAQNKSLQIFAGEAYLVEQGVSNELFPQDRGEPSDRPALGERGEPKAGCLFMGSPKDGTNFSNGTTTGTPSDTVLFSAFMGMLAPPQPAAQSASARAGQAKFNQVGCAMCHTPSMQTGKSYIAALSEQKVNLFSDLLLHDMGSGLADRVGQGDASGTQFRTAPLWGVGQRIFFLHDGRTSDMLEAVQQHASHGSEANQVISNFNALSTADQQSILDFLRSL